MVEKLDRYRIGEYPRNAVETEWEVFVREREGDPLHHAGSVSASTAQIAYEETTKLFAWYAKDIWICPASDVHRYSTHTLDEQAAPVELSTDGEERTYEA